MSKKILLPIGAAVLVLASILLLRANKQEPVVTNLPSEQIPLRSVIGYSVEGRALEAYTYGSGTTHLVFVGGIHGGYEWNSVVLAYEMMDYLKAQPTMLGNDVMVTVIPNANPDGVFRIVGKEGRFAASDVPAGDQSAGRFNANKVDLNRNFDCKWQPESTWRGNKVSAGTSAFSEPEARAVRDFALKQKPDGFIFWHSQANAVYASECTAGILPETRAMMSAYAAAAGYTPVDTFDAYTVTGDAEGWLASVGIPAITVELATHEAVEFEKNLAGVKALMTRYAK